MSGWTSSGGAEHAPQPPDAPLPPIDRVADLLTQAAARWGARAALRGVGADAAMSFRELAQRFAPLRQRFEQWGVTPGDRVATFLPAGPTAVGVMLGVMGAGTYAPLNPRYAAGEVRRALLATRARWVIVEKGISSAGRIAAAELGLAIIEVAAADATAGALTVTCDQPAKGAGRAGDALAYVLLTSGTTGIPKVVPMGMANFLHAIAVNVEALGLTPRDCCLHFSPPASVMGMTTVLYSLMAGAEVVACPGLLPSDLWHWTKRFAPTWLTGTPAIHHAILHSAAGNEEAQQTARDARIRFLRTASAPMSPALWDAVETLWQAPLVEAYAMSECPMITTNDVTADQRRRGSVGRARGVEVAVIDDSGRMLLGVQRIGVTGELAVRGPAVMAGYENNEQANEAAFREGWLLTGDVGTFDGEGFLYLRGRKKELINRGGMKISPLEVEAILARHSAVAEVAVFALPDERLGETVGAAVVLRSGLAASEADLRQFVAQDLGMEKVPERVLVVKKLPVGPTGKVRRLGLAEKLGLTAATPSPPQVAAACVAPSDAAEEALAAIWGHVLSRPGPLSVEAHFMRDLGGDSMQAVAMLAEAAHYFGRDLPVAMLLALPSIRALAAALRGVAVTAPNADVAAIQPRGQLPALFCLPGKFGHSFNFFPLSRALGDDQPVYALTLPGVYDDAREMPRSLEALAAGYLRQVRELRPAGPYFLAGYSFGGYVAFEMARQLAAAGQAVGHVILFDTRGPGYPRRRSFLKRMAYQLGQVRQRGWAHVAERTKARLGRPRWKAEVAAQGLEGRVGVSEKAMALVRAWVPQVFEGPVTLIRAREQPAWFAACEPDITQGWGRWAPQLDIAESGGDHDHMLESRYIAELSALIRPLLSRPSLQ